MSTGHRARGVTMGQAAAFAGVTLKTVRHYHRVGVLDEPARDGSGYRRYGSSELLRLIQARTLARAGVPLAEVRNLLDTDADGSAEAFREIERHLTAQIDELVHRREDLRRLRDTDRSLLPDRARAILHRMSEDGWPAEAVSTYREDMVLARALVPTDFDGYLAQIEVRVLDDHRLRDLYRRCWAAETWDPDDPRLAELADEMAGHLLAHPHLLHLPDELLIGRDGPVRYGLLNHHRHDEAPAWARLTALVEARLREAGVAVPSQ